jgi:hypothetical protein
MARAQPLLRRQPRRPRYCRVRRNGRAFWEPGQSAKSPGFRSVPLGPDGPDAWSIAEQLNHEWDAARRTAAREFTGFNCAQFVETYAARNPERSNCLVARELERRRVPTEPRERPLAQWLSFLSALMRYLSRHAF